MICYKCSGTLDLKRDVCSKCGTDIRYFKKIVYMSNRYYNDGLMKAQARDLTGARDSLRKSLKLYKKNVSARNLLGLVDYAMGESAEALKEWVISKSYRETGNSADRYINHTRRNAKDLDSENHGIKRYNQALELARSDGKDLAVIQLKKVISVHPNMTKAYVLLALLYIESEKKDLALTMLNRCLEVDRGNPMALYYMRELDRMSRKGGAKSAGVVGEEDREQLIIPVRFRDFGSYLSNAVYILLGAAIGIAIAWFVIVPGRVEKKTADNQAVVRSYEEEISKLQQESAAAAAEQENESTEESTGESEEEISGSESETEEAEESTEWYQPVYEKYTYWTDNNNAVIEALNDWTSGDKAACMQLFVKMETTLVSDPYKSFYYDFSGFFVDAGTCNDVMQEAQEAMDDADFETAAAYYDIASEMQRSKSAPKYNAGRAYEEAGMTDEALSRYYLVVNLFPDSEERADAEARYLALSGEDEVPGLPDGVDPEDYTTNITREELLEGLDYTPEETTAETAAAEETAAGETSGEETSAAETQAEDTSSAVTETTAESAAGN